MYIFVYICVCICIYIFLYICIYIHMHMYIYMYVFVYIYSVYFCAHGCLCIRLYWHICIYVNLYIRVYSRICTFIQVYGRCQMSCVKRFLCTCMFIRAYILGHLHVLHTHGPHVTRTLPQNINTHTTKLSIDTPCHAGGIARATVVCYCHCARAGDSSSMAGSNLQTRHT